MVTVWSERSEPTGDHVWRDCGYCAYLMALRWAGLPDDAFPLGPNTVAEREAFERMDDRPNETGSNPEDCDLASSRRYKVSLHHLTPGETWQQVVADTKSAFIIGGSMGNFPVGHHLRRWDPSFDGSHGICIRPLGGGKVWWGDPLATMGYAGETVAVADVLKFVGNFDAGWFARRGIINEFKPTPVRDVMILTTGRIDQDELRPLFDLDVKAGAPLCEFPDLSGKLGALPAREWLPLEGTPAGFPDSRAVFKNTKKGGAKSIVYIPASYVLGQRDRTDPTPYSREELQKALEEQIQPLKDQLQNLEDGISAKINTAVAEAVGPFLTAIQEALEQLNPTNGS